ncbi:MAG: cytidine deaminase family protein [Myxococcaceae bacterium]
MSPDEELIAAARAILGTFKLVEYASAASVAAALRTRSGRIFTGVCLDFSCGLGFCAEHSAIAEMLKSRETTIRDIVAVSDRGVVPPCGRCRELILQVSAENTSTRVLLPNDSSTTIAALLPHHWL